MTIALLLLTAIARAASGGHAAEEPVRVVEETVPLPPGLALEEALQSVEDIPGIFALYQPLVPKIPGIDVALSKEVVSASVPAVLELPVSGNAIGYKFTERARVTASTEHLVCPTGFDGRKIVLDFHASSYNIERRIDRIEIVACPEVDDDGSTLIRATGRMYEGFKPQDPDKSAISEAIGSRALQTAFIKQVSPILTAVQARWALL
ncbi:MAG: hypothetical protein R3F59_23055 [Myxococcota bacterium]